MTRDTQCNIPDLFPGRLLELCEQRVLAILRTTGRHAVHRASQPIKRSAGWLDYPHLSSASSFVSREYASSTSSIVARALPEWLKTPPSPAHYSSNEVFLEEAQVCREFLSAFLATPVLDSLSQLATQSVDMDNPESVFTFTVLCGDRLSRLVVHQHTDVDNPTAKAWASFISSPQGDPLMLSCLSQLHSLSCLYMHYVATNDMLYVISTVCTKLVLLDISYSQNVTDIGLVHLCGVLKGPPGEVHSGPEGCKYLRELYFNPQSNSTQELIMPRVTACLLRHLPMLQVVDLSNLHAGLEHYLRGTRESTHRQSRVKPLNLIHYTGSDRLADVMNICPKLRTFKLFVTEQLHQLGAILKGLNHSLDQVTLVYAGQSTADNPAGAVLEEEEQMLAGDEDGLATHGKLTGFQQFLAECGRKICRLEVDCTQRTVISRDDLMAVATNCPQLEALTFTNFRVEVEVDRRISHAPPVPTKPARFPFLTHVRICNVSIEEYGKDIFRYLLGGAFDLETIQITFHNPGYFFSDFLLDDILMVNELAHLQKFLLRGGALTLISALRLISSRPKLRTIGGLLDWDVEPSELATFIQILRRAKSLNLLQDIHIF